MLLQLVCKLTSLRQTLLQLVCGLCGHLMRCADAGPFHVDAAFACV